MESGGVRYTGSAGGGGGDTCLSVPVVLECTPWECTSGWLCWY